MQHQKLNSILIGLLATGDELVEGDILNTNGQAIASACIKQGFTMGLHVVCPDNDDDIAHALNFLLKSHSIIIITGGLGPTSDDRTRFALSHVAGKELQLDEPTWQAICARIQRRLGRDAHPSNQQQALFPEDSQIIPNENGTAAGCWLKIQEQTIYMLPGPPHECLPMFEGFVLPHILANTVEHKRFKFSWKLKGAVESEIGTQIDEALQNFPVRTGYRATPPFLEVKIYTDSHEQVDAILKTIMPILTPYLTNE